jgi:glycosyltransferase involved in cell wall biosynthesis
MMSSTVERGCMKISVLILTHNRPELFVRCINSVIEANKLHPVDLEIIVNNDSMDIEEIHKDITSYQYEKYDDLSMVYLSLFKRASKDYIYYLEDDDVMSVDFFRILSEYDDDIFYFNYIPYTWHSHFVRSFKYTDGVYTKEGFLSQYNDHDFQFGQICFRKKCLDVDKFPTGNNMSNDFVIFKMISGSFRTINKFLFTQTTDGGDNISFRKKVV